MRVPRAFNVFVSASICVGLNSCASRQFSERDRAAMSSVSVEPVSMQLSSYKKADWSSGGRREMQQGAKDGAKVGLGIMMLGAAAPLEAGEFGVLLAAPIILTGAAVSGASLIAGGVSMVESDASIPLSSSELASLEKSSHWSTVLLYNSLKQSLRSNHFFQPRMREASDVAFHAQVRRFQYVGTEDDASGQRLLAVSIECQIELKNGSSKTYFSKSYQAESSGSYTATAYAADRRLVHAMSQQAVNTIIREFSADLAVKTQ